VCGCRRPKSFDQALVRSDRRELGIAEIEADRRCEQGEIGELIEIACVRENDVRGALRLANVPVKVPIEGVCRREVTAQREQAVTFEKDASLADRGTHDDVVDGRIGGGRGDLQQRHRALAGRSHRANGAVAG